MNLLASVQMPVTPSSSTSTGHNNDLVDNVDELWPATPSASTTTTGNNDNNPVDDIAAEVVPAAPSAATATGPNDDPVGDHPDSVQVPATPSAGTTAIDSNDNNPVDDLARTLSNLLLPPSSAQDPAAAIRDYLLPCIDIPSICKLALVHPDLHTILSTSLFVSTGGIRCMDRTFPGFRMYDFWNTPLVWDLFRCLPKLRELLYPIRKEKYIPSGLRTLHLLGDESHGTSLLTSIFQDAHLPSLRCLTLVNFGKVTVNSMRHILRACPHLRHISFRLTNFSSHLEAVYALPLEIESHPDFVDRLPGWSSNINLDDYYNSTDLYCFVSTEVEGEDEQEGGEGIVMDSPLGSLAPLYEDLIRYNSFWSGWEVHEEEFRPKKKDLKAARKRKARGAGWEGGGCRLGGGEGRGEGGGGGGASVGATAGGGGGGKEAGGSDNSVDLLRGGAHGGGE